MLPRRRASFLPCHWILSALALAGLTACTGAGGEVSVLVEPESTITGGIPAGAGAEEIQDGWSVIFSKYIMTLGPIELRTLTGESSMSDPGRWAIDLVQIPSRGEALWQVTGLSEERWDLYFATEDGNFERHDSVSEADFETLQEEGLTHLIDGEMTHPSGVSCPPAELAMVPAGAEPTGQNAADDNCYAAPSVAFSIRVTAEVTYGPCSIDGLPGVAVVAGEERAAAITMHGDHLFFGGFPEGSEGEVRRYAQWLADCDLDLDGTVTTEELERIPPAALVELDERFPLGGSPVRPLDDMLTYLESQLSTQGHFEGEGECSIGFEPLDASPNR